MGSATRDRWTVRPRTSSGVPVWMNLGAAGRDPHQRLSDDSYEARTSSKAP